MTLTAQAALKVSDKLSIEFNKNVELVGFVYFLGFEGENIETSMLELDGEWVPKKEWHNYGYTFYQAYKTYRTDEDLNKAFSAANHLWLDVIIHFLLQVDDFPNARLTKDIPLEAYLPFSPSKDPVEARKNVEIFLEGLNNFYQTVDFDAYLAANQTHYEVAIQEVHKTLADPKFVDQIEAFFQKSFEAYRLVPSLTLPKGMGFGLKRDNQQIYSVFGALDWQEIEHPNHLDLGFQNAQKLRELSIHEFGHSFCNPIVNQLPAALINETEALYQPIARSMADQGYMTWKASVYEHFVRASELIIAKRYDTQEAYQALKKEYLEDRQFIYIPTIIGVLANFQAEGLSLEAAIEKSMVRLQEKMQTASKE